ncbi:MAG: hypoxanthine phosphoribosyltransferase, partial [Verrucomicrobia bacterium]|nr:hypoxanthine phosphoribosyltransferase [Verrucomicrobiota bacterium]
MVDEIERVLFREEQILERLDQLAAEITADYQGKDLTVIAILNGSLIFMADLLRRIPLPLQLDCLRVRSYYDRKVSTGKVAFDASMLPDLQKRHVLLLDDILDSGHTLAALVDEFRAHLKPISL